MASKHTQRASHTEPAAIAVRYFQLYEDLAAGGSALAYPCRWDLQSGTWKKIDVPQERLRHVYDRKNGEGAEVDDFVQCVWMPGSRRWEILAAIRALFYRGITTEDLDKGSSADVTRYEPGTTTPTGDDPDEVNNELADIGTGKVVYYLRDGSNLYVFAAECPLK
jgi:hypothetical protein